MFGKKKPARRNRLSGHSLGGGSYGRGRARSLENYDPNQELADSISSPYSQAMASGSGMAKAKQKAQTPTNLHGRSSFSKPNSPLGRNESGAGQSKNTRGNTWSKNPRGFIKF